MPAIGGRQPISISYRDYSGELESIRLYAGEITAVSLPGFLSAFGTLQTALDAVFQCLKRLVRDLSIRLTFPDRITRLTFLPQKRHVIRVIRVIRVILMRMTTRGLPDRPDQADQADQADQRRCFHCHPKNARPTSTTGMRSSHRAVHVDEWPFITQENFYGRIEETH